MQIVLQRREGGGGGGSGGGGGGGGGGGDKDSLSFSPSLCALVCLARPLHLLQGAQMESGLELCCLPISGPHCVVFCVCALGKPLRLKCWREACCQEPGRETEWESERVREWQRARERKEREKREAICAHFDCVKIMPILAAARMGCVRACLCLCVTQNVCLNSDIHKCGLVCACVPTCVSALSATHLYLHISVCVFVCVYVCRKCGLFLCMWVCV